jgi:hypothetical protein
MDFLKPASQRTSPTYLILRRNEEVYLRPQERHRLQPALAASPGVFRRPCLYRINAEQASFRESGILSRDTRRDVDMQTEAAEAGLAEACRLTTAVRPHAIESRKPAR